jgi:hypothetical protein
VQWSLIRVPPLLGVSAIDIEEAVCGDWPPYGAREGSLFHFGQNLKISPIHAPHP